MRGIDFADDDLSLIKSLILQKKTNEIFHLLSIEILEKTWSIKITADYFTDDNMSKDTSKIFKVYCNHILKEKPISIILECILVLDPDNFIKLLKYFEKLNNQPLIGSVSISHFLSIFIIYSPSVFKYFAEEYEYGIPVECLHYMGCHPENISTLINIGGENVLKKIGEYFKYLTINPNCVEILINSDNGCKIIEKEDVLKDFVTHPHCDSFDIIVRKKKKLKNRIVSILSNRLKRSSCSKYIVDDDIFINIITNHPDIFAEISPEFHRYYPDLLLQHHKCTASCMIEYLNKLTPDDKMDLDKFKNANTSVMYSINIELLEHFIPKIHGIYCPICMQINKYNSINIHCGHVICTACSKKCRKRCPICKHDTMYISIYQEIKYGISNPDEEDPFGNKIIKKSGAASGDDCDSDTDSMTSGYYSD